MIDYLIADDGIATIAFNVADRPMNVLNDSSISSFSEAVERAVSDPSVKGVIVTSVRPEFVVGADLEVLRDVTDPIEVMEQAGRLSRLLRRIETSGKPFVAAINGTALGGGFEICLACHRRIAATFPKTRLGLPEVTLGLLPGAGGTQRLPRMIGLEKAMPFLLEGRQVDVDVAAKAGLVDEVVPQDELLKRARAWLLHEGAHAVVQPWDCKGFKLPGGDVQSPAGRQLFMAASAGVRAKTAGLYPAPVAILTCLHDGCHGGFDAGLAVELRQFAKLAVSPEAQNMIRTLFYAMGEANKLAGRPAGFEKRIYRKVGVLGAGMMGSGIAHVSAVAGLEVVLVDTTVEAAEKGRAQTLASLKKKVAGGRMESSELAAIAARIVATDDFSQLAGVDIVVEAVFEDRAIKADVTRRAEAVLPPDAIFATNTSTLPITGLAEASSRPEQFVGLHFFSPVERMPLVEVINGKQTSKKTLAHAMDFVKQIRKTPIVVNDGRAFYTSRVFGTYVYEGMALLADGVAPALIERAGTNAGMPIGPLALMDEISTQLMHKVMRQTQDDLGSAYVEQPQDKVLIRMVETLGRMGRKSGAGFYDYFEDGSKRLWHGLAEEFPLAGEQPTEEEVRQRLMFIQSIEAARCLEQNIVGARDADVGSILGWGFPAALGGVVSQIDTVGLERFIAVCDVLAQRHGPRFLSPAILRDRLADGGRLRAA